MKRITLLGVLLILIFALRLVHSLVPARQAGRSAQTESESPHGLTSRSAWTTSRVQGSPEPPPPYRSELAFPKLKFKNPLLLTNAPGTQRLFVGEQVGKLYSFPNDPACATADLFLDLTTEVTSFDRNKIKGVGAVYGLTFHPQFVKNRYCYVCYIVISTKPGEQLADGTRVSRFRVTDTEPPRCDPRSEQVLLTWMAGGHNGGNLKFGPDGCLYISTGDAANPNPPDVFDTGQDLSDLLSSVLRIDVDHADPGKTYSVPPDNPFVKTPGARREIWAYGFRNPWQMSFDRVTGDLWVGDVGWELWEMVYRVQRGGNYGWSVMEGRQPVRPDSKRGPTPILPPTLDFPHTEAASITGGFVYRGKRLPDLVGAYICGDWETRKLWGTRFNDKGVAWHKELAQTTQRIVAFSEDNDGELYFVDYNEAGGIHKIVPNVVQGQHAAPFPRRLSETGLLASTARHQPAAGVLPFAINAEQWADHATAERFVALPGKGTVTVHDSPTLMPGTTFQGRYHFPKDGVLMKTLSLEMERGNPASQRLLETQLLHFDGSGWRGYSYQWNEDQTDATLVDAAGLDRVYTVKDAQAPGGWRKQKWHFPGRAQCLQCHNPWADYTLAFTPAQLNRAVLYGKIVDNQLRALGHIGVLTRGDRKAADRPSKPPGKLANPYDPAADLDERARSYLHVNCSHCHQFGAGGTADIELRSFVPLEQTKALEVRPVQGMFDIPAAQILAPGDPYRSVLYYRMAKLGGGRMPHVGSEVVDEPGLALIHDWIRQLPIRKDEMALIAKLRELDEPAALAREQEQAPRQLQRLAEDIARAAGREKANDSDQAKAREQLQTRCQASVKERASNRIQAISQLLKTPSSALLLLRALDDGRIPAATRPQVLALAQAYPEGQVRDLFERYIPDDQRVKRLGSVIQVQELLALKGDAVRGKELFFNNQALGCVRCHRVGGKGGTVGPELDAIGKKLDRAKLLESIVEPSREIDPKYQPALVELTDGRVLIGLLVQRTEKEYVLRTVEDKELRLPAASVERFTQQRISLMPDGLLRDLTAEQAADLLTYLHSLQGTP